MGRPRLLVWCFIILTTASTLPRVLANRPDLPFDPVNTQSNELCWERCFQIEDEDEERYREVYDDFYRMGMEARRLKNLFGINGTAVLLDSTLSARNPEDYDNPVYQSPRGHSTARQIWEFQRNLASIVMILMGTQEDHNPIYMVQFDDQAANSCDEFHCLHACEANYILDTELNEPRRNAFVDGNIEAACSMSKHYMEMTSCVASIKNEMAIAFLNSGIDFHKYHYYESSSSSSSESYEHHRKFKPCHAHFDTRMAIGTHVARWENLDRWSTSAARPFYFHDNIFTMNAARQLRMCLSKRCCPTGLGFYMETIEGDVCKITKGKEGEAIVGYPGHTSFGPN